MCLQQANSPLEDNAGRSGRAAEVDCGVQHSHGCTLLLFKKEREQESEGALNHRIVVLTFCQVNMLFNTPQAAATNEPRTRKHFLVSHDVQSHELLSHSF